MSNFELKEYCKGCNDLGKDNLCYRLSRLYKLYKPKLVTKSQECFKGNKNGKNIYI